MDIPSINARNDHMSDSSTAENRMVAENTYTDRPQVKKREENNEKDDGFYGFLNLGLGLEYERFDFSASNIPAELRTVPEHHDDHYTNPGPYEIKDSRVSVALPLSLSVLTFGVGYGSGDINVDAGLRPKALFGITEIGHINEYNYVSGGDSRGYGAALVYYGLATDGPTGLGTWFVPEGFLRVSKKSEQRNGLGTQVFGEYSIKQYDLDIENGWDRYDKLQIHDTYKIAGILNHQLSAGAKFYGGGTEGELKITYNLYNVSPSGYGKECKIDNPTVPFGINGMFYYHFDIK